MNHREDNRGDSARRRDLRRERLLRAGRDLFAGQGYDRTSIGQVCSAAKVSTRAFYEEFSGRQALLLALHEKCASAGREAVAEVMREPDIDEADTAGRIGRVFAAYTDAVTRDPAAARVAFVELQGAGKEAEEHRLAWGSVWTDLFAAEAARAVSRKEAADRDHSLAIVGLIGAVNELLAHWSRRPPGAAPAPSVLSEELTRLALAALGSPVREEW